MEELNKNVHEETERERLRIELEILDTQIRQKLLLIVSHPGVSEAFKNLAEVKEWTK